MGQEECSLRDRAGQVLPLETRSLHRPTGHILFILSVLPLSRAQLHSLPVLASILLHQQFAEVCLQVEHGWGGALARGRGSEKCKICPILGQPAGWGGISLGAHVFRCPRGPVTNTCQENSKKYIKLQPNLYTNIHPTLHILLPFLFSRF